MTKEDFLGMKFQDVPAKNKAQYNGLSVMDINRWVVSLDSPAILGKPNALFNLAVAINNECKMPLFNYQDKCYHLFGLDVPFQSEINLDCDIVLYSKTEDNYIMIRIWQI